MLVRCILNFDANLLKEFLYPLTSFLIFYDILVFLIFNITDIF